MPQTDSPHAFASLPHQQSRGCRAGALTMCAAMMAALAGCAGGYGGGNDPALGRNGSSMGISGSSSNGVQLYGTADVSVGTVRSSSSGGSTSQSRF